MPEKQDEAEAPGCTIYFVDDDRGVVHSSVQWLTLSGLKVQAFADPKLLLRTIRPNDPCVVVSDIRMPDLDGMSLMKHIHARDKQIPVILITGHGDIPLAVEAMKLGAHEFLTKPVSPEQLLDVIATASRRRLQHLANVAQPDAALTRKPEKQVVETVPQNASSLKHGDAGPLNTLVDKYEKTVIEAALKKCGGDISLALKELDLPRRTLNSKMKKYGISRRSFR